MFDPRDAFIAILDGKVKVNDDKGVEQNIPVYYGEEARKDKALPLVTLSLVLSPKHVADIGGGQYHSEALVDCHIYTVQQLYQSMPGFIRRISDKVEDLVEASEKTVTGCDFVQCLGARDLEEPDNKNVCHRVIEIHAYKTKT